MTAHLIDKALAAWGLGNCSCDLIAQRENKVYRVQRPDGSLCVLRIHRKNLRTDEQIISELHIMQALHLKGQIVPAPILNTSETFMAVIDGAQIDLLSWVEGRSMHDVPMADRVNVFKRLGRLTAGFHNVIDRWEQPPKFSRPSWDRENLIGDTPLWGVFWENPYLSASDVDIILRAKADIKARLKAIEVDLDYGLIHADMVRENVLLAGDDIGLIDFDDSGFGFRVFELATILQAQLDEANYTQIKTALLEGYMSKRIINIDMLDMFIVLRTWTYLGWIISKFDGAAAKDRNERYVKRSVRRAKQWLDGVEIR